MFEPVYAAAPCGLDVELLQDLDREREVPGRENLVRARGLVAVLGPLLEDQSEYHSLRPGESLALSFSVGRRLREYVARHRMSRATISVYEDAKYTGELVFRAALRPSF
jgi:hypothetical protein